MVVDHTSTGLGDESARLGLPIPDSSSQRRLSPHSRCIGGASTTLVSMELCGRGARDWATNAGPAGKDWSRGERADAIGRRPQGSAGPEARKKTPLRHDRSNGAEGRKMSSSYTI